MKDKIINILEGLGYETLNPFEDLVNALCIKDERTLILEQFKEEKGVL